MPVQLTIVYYLAENNDEITKEFEVVILPSTTYAEVFQMVMEKKKINLSATSMITTPSTYSVIKLGAATPEFCERSILSILTTLKGKK